MTPAPPTPAIRSRLALALAGWSVAGGLAIALAVWLTVSHEVGELLDDSLEAAAAMLVAYLPEEALRPGDAAAAAATAAAAAVPANEGARFAWQLVSREGQVLRRSLLAPEKAWWQVAHPGFSNAPNWRVYGLTTARDGQTLYAAQSRAERQELRAEAAMITALATLAIACLGHVWITRRMRQELAPLQALSLRLAQPIAPDGTAGPQSLAAPVTLGPASRQELQPVHDAIDGLTQRLHQRLLAERAFAGHAAHALRTPLAGIDAQLAVALREVPPAQQPRIARVREAATRLQGVVAALLALFRSAGGVQLQRVDIAALFARLPTAGLMVRLPTVVRGALLIEADEDLLAAALVNLLDNAVRHGAKVVTVSMPGPRALRLHDDGPGVSAARRAGLSAALAAEPQGREGDRDSGSGSASDSRIGLGLALAARVAQAHGGQVVLPAVDEGFAVELWLGGAAPTLTATPNAAH